MPNDRRIRLGLYIERLRKEQGYNTRKQLADAAGVGLSTVDKIERGERVTDSKINAIAYTLNCVDKVREILHGQEPTEPEPDGEDLDDTDALADALRALRRLAGDTAFTAAVAGVLAEIPGQRRSA